MFNFKRYEGEIYAQYVEFEYPEEWILKDLSDFFLKNCECRALWIYGPWNKRNTCSTLLSFMIYPLNVNNPCYHHAEESLKRQSDFIHSLENELGVVRKLFPEFAGRKNEILATSDITVDGNRARELMIAKVISGIRPQIGSQKESFNYQEGERSINRYVAFEKNSCIYEFSYQAPEDEDEKYMEVYERFLSTFRVLSS